MPDKPKELLPQWMCDLIDRFPWSETTSDEDVKRSYACEAAGLLILEETEKDSFDEQEYGEHVFRLSVLGDKCLAQIEETRTQPSEREKVDEVKASHLSGDMVNALYNYKILQGIFGDTAAQLLINKIRSKYPNGLKIIGD